MTDFSFHRGVNGVTTNAILSSNINTEDSLASLPIARLPLHQIQRTNEQLSRTVMTMRGRVVTVHTLQRIVSTSSEAL